MRRLDRQSMCEGKTAFAGRMQAKYKAHFQRDGYCAYFCPFCHFWHIGGSSTAARAARHMQQKTRHDAGMVDVRKLLEDE